MALRVFLILAFCLGLVACGSDGKCRGLIFSGGGDKGAYEAGALMAFTQLLPAQEVSYDIIAGTSAGSLNVAGFALSKQGEETQGAQLIKDVWDTITKNDVYKNWAMGIPQGLFMEYGIYDTSPLFSFLKDFFDQHGGKTLRDFSIVVTNAMEAFPVRINQTATGDELLNWIMASSAFPVFLPHIQQGQYPYMDG